MHPLLHPPWLLLGPAAISISVLRLAGASSSSQSQPSVAPLPCRRLVVLLLSMWRFQKLQLVAADSQAQLSPGPSASLPSGSDDAQPLGKGAAGEAAEEPIVETV